MKPPVEIISDVLRPGPIGEHSNGPELVAIDIIEHLSEAGYAIIKESDRFAMQEKAWMYDELCK